jgi:hypothetical protein
VFFAVRGSICDTQVASTERHLHSDDLDAMLQAIGAGINEARDVACSHLKMWEEEDRERWQCHHYCCVIPGGVMTTT